MFVMARLACLILALWGLCLPLPAAADDPFAKGWSLQSEGSTLGFVSVKNDTKVEMNSIATFTGAITPQGAAEVHIALDSIDTHIDLRNVRMRFLFFETFKFPEAVVRATIDPALLADLTVKRRVIVRQPFSLTLHGVTREMTADVAVTLISEDMVAVASVGVIPILAEDFDLSAGVAKLQDAAKVKLVPVGSVAFDWVFTRTGAGVQPLVGAATAKEAQGNFDPAECKDRFDTLSHSGNITFRRGSDKLDVAGSAVLDTLLDVVKRCPEMRLEVGGHTDDVGTDAANMTLSLHRAASVVDYLVAGGAAGDRLTARGYGKVAPLVPNDTPDHRAQNRRIEFKVLE